MRWLAMALDGAEGRYWVW